MPNNRKLSAACKILVIFLLLNLHPECYSNSLLVSPRGVYTAALNHAKEATVLSPDAFGYDDMDGLRRFDEAVNAEQSTAKK